MCRFNGFYCMLSISEKGKFTPFGNANQFFNPLKYLFLISNIYFNFYLGLEKFHPSSHKIHEHDGKLGKRWYYNMMCGTMRKPRFRYYNMMSGTMRKSRFMYLNMICGTMRKPCYRYYNMTCSRVQ
jgi:hypothetical protein